MMDKDFSDNPLKMLLGSAQKIKDQVESAQKEMAKVEVCGRAGGDLVQIVVNGNRKVLSVTIDDSAMSDKAMLQDLVAAAANDAAAKLEEAMRDSISESVVPEALRDLL